MSAIRAGESRRSHSGGVKAAAMLLCLCAAAQATTYYWNRNAVLTSDLDLTRAYNWTANVNGTGAYPTSTTDDDFSAGTLNSKWTCQDADANAGTGTCSVTANAGQLTLNGAGADVFGANNAYTAVYRKDIPGNFDVSVKVVSLDNSNANSKAGIMLANNFTSLSSGGHVHMCVTATAGVKFEYDSSGTVGNLNKSQVAAGVSAPVWLRLVKSGYFVTAYYKTAVGNAWTQLGIAQNAESAELYNHVGLFMTSHVAATAGNAVFDDFQGGTAISGTGYDLSFAGSGANHNSSGTVSSSVTAASIDFTGYTGTVNFGGQNGLFATYYDDIDLTTTSAARVDTTLNFNWPSAAPAAGLAATNWSAVWEGYVQPNYTETYTFISQVDNGVRLWVNGTQLVDNWYGTGIQNDSGTIALTAGTKYLIHMEMIHTTSATAQAVLRWKSTSQTREVIPKRCLFAGNFAVTGNVNMGANMTVTAGDGTIDFSGTSGTQVFTPRSGQTHPRILHSGASTLQLSTNALTAIGFAQSAGVLDFNGQDIFTALSGTNRGDFAIWNGTSTSLTGLGGRTLTIVGNASFTGTSGNLLDLNPSSAWTLTVAGAQTAYYATIKNCNANGASTFKEAYSSADSTGNSGWTIEPNTYYWNRNNIITTTSDPLKAYNWTSAAGDSGFRPVSILDDKFEGNTLGSAWTFRDVDGNDSTGTYALTGGQLILSSRGADVWYNTGGTQDRYSSIYRTDITGDFDVSVKVVSVSAANANTKTGIMISNDYPSTGGYFVCFVTSDGHVKLEYDDRSTSPGFINSNAASVNTFNAPLWLRVAKKGTAVTGYYKMAQNKNWVSLATVTLAGTNANSQIGLFLSAHTTTVTAMSVMDDFQAGVNISPTDYDLSLNGTGTNADANMTMAAAQACKSIDFTGYSGTFNFGGQTLTVNSGDANLNFAGTLTVNSGTIAFTGSGAQTFTPKNGSSAPSITQSGSGTTTISTFSAQNIPLLTISNGTFHLGSGISGNGALALALSGGTLNFGSSTLSTAAATADFSGIGAIVVGTGTLKFNSSNPQVFIPKSGATFPAITESGTGTTTVTTNGLTAGAFSITGGGWSWGSVTSSVASIATSGGTATMAFATGTVNVTSGNCDLSGLSSITNTSGTLGFTATSGTQTFTPLSGATHPAISKSGAVGTVTVATNGLTSGALTVTNGTWNWGSGLTHAPASIATSGAAATMAFGTSTVNVTTGNADLSGLSAITNTSGTLGFTGTAGTQVLTPLSGASHPAVSKSGAGTLQLATNALICAGYSQSAGTLDFNSLNLTTNSSGNFTLTNGASTSFTNLGGRTLTVAGNASFTGQSGNLVDMNPGSSWTAAVTGTLAGSYCSIANSNASVTRGAATLSTSGGGNTNWSFASTDYSSWTYSTPINFNTTSTGANVSGNVTNFPMLIRLDSNNFVFTQAMPDGRDIRFSDPDGSLLYYEIERWDATNKKALVWVKVPQVDGNSSQDFITMYWGNSSATSLSQASAVFGAYALAYHLVDDPNGSAPQYTDASGNANSGTAQNKASSDSTAALISAGYKLDGSVNKYISTTTQFSNPSTFTISAWFKGTTTSGGKILGFGNAQTGANGAGSFDRMLWMDNTGKVSFGINNGSNRVLTSTSAYNDGAWHSTTGRLSSNGMFFYVDGALVTSNAGYTSAINMTGYWRVGYDAMTGWTPLPTNSNFTGTVDEIRVAHSELSADWIKLSYETQRQNSTALAYPNTALSTWAYSTKLYINTTSTGAGVQSDQTNFPLLVRLNKGNFNFSQAKSDGGDLRFADSTGALLSYEIERFDATNKIGEVWVLIPSVKGNNNSQWFKMYWGKSSATSIGSSSAVFTASNGYVGVWHLNGAFTDATSYGNNGTNTATTANASANIAAGRTFDGSTTSIDVGGGSTGSSLHASSAVTVEGWANPTTLAASQKIIMKPFTSNANPLTEYDIGVNSSGTVAKMQVNTGGTVAPLSGTTKAAYTTGAWSYVAGTYDGANMRLYFNGTEDTSKAVTGTITDYAQTAKIGTNVWVSAQTWNGSLDEIRVSNVARSGDWVKLCYQNQVSGSSVVQIGNRPGDFTKSAQFTFNTTSTGANVSGNVTNIPILIRLTSANFDFSVTDSAGRDIQFIDKDGTYLYHEVEEWDRKNQSGKVWVRVPQVDGNSSSDYIKLYYGCSNCSGAPYAVSDSVWSAYAGVYHINAANDARGTDATHFGNHLGFNINTPNNPGLTTPLTSYFDGADGSYYSVADPAGGDLDVGTGDFSIGCWIKTSQAAPASNKPKPVSKYQTTGPTGYDIEFGNSGSNPGKATVTLNSAGTPYSKTSASTLNDGSWHYLVAAKSGSNLNLYVDGAVQGSATTYSGASLDNTGAFAVGNSTYGSDGFQGNVAEAFVIKSALSANFIKLAYQNQRSADSLFVNATRITTASFQNSKVFKFNTTSTGANITGDVYNYPLLIRLAGSTIIGACLSAGQDIRFMGSDGTWLDYSIERWKTTAIDSAEIWVKVPVIHGNSTTDYITLYYQQASGVTVPDGQCATCVFDGSNFKSVYHMDENAGNNTVTDVRGAYGGSFFQTGANTVSNTSAHTTYGPIGANALSFNGSSDWISLGATSNIVQTVPAVTLSAWVNASSLGSLNDVVFLSKNGSNSQSRAKLSLVTSGGTAGFLCAGGRSHDGESQTVDTATTSNLSTTTWYHVAAVVDYASDTVRIFRNGVRLAPLHKIGFQNRMTANATSNTTGIGARSDGSSEYFAGSIDEVRISATALDTNWIKLDYQTQRTDAAPLFQTSSTDFNYTQNFYFNTTKTGANIGAAVTNYPLLVRITNATIIDGVRMSGSTPQDIRFMDGDGKTWLNYSVERWSQAQDSAEVWVLVPQIDANSTTDKITLYYGEKSANLISDGSSATSVFSTTNGFTMVWHLNEDGNTTGNGYVDVTGNALHGTGSAMTNSSDVQAAIGTGQNLTAASLQYITVADNNLLDFTTNMTASLWAYASSWGPGATDNRRVFQKGGDGTSYALREATDVDSLQFDIGGPTGTKPIIADPSAAAWHYYAETYNGTSAILYVDGVAVSTKSMTGSISNSNGALDLGRKPTSVTSRDFFNGTVDEFRLGSSARSADWILLDYETQRPSGSKFWGVRPGPNNIATLTASSTTNGINLSWSATPSDSSNADSVGIWVKYGAYPDSANTASTTFVVKRPKTDSTYFYPATYPATYYFGLAVRNSNGKWSPITSASVDTAVYSYSISNLDTVYVDSAIGSNSNTCTQARNPATPFLSVEDAIACATSANASDTLVIRAMPGTYATTRDNDFAPPGTIPAVVASFDGNSRAVLSSTEQAGYTVKLSSFMVLRNMDIRAATNHATGIRVVSGADSIIIDGCKIYNASSTVKHDTAIAVINSGADKILIANSAIVSPNTVGVYAECNNLFNVINNVFYGPGTTNSRALVMPTDVPATGGITVTNNIFHGWDYGIDNTGQNGSSGTTSNNLFYLVTSGNELVNESDANKVLKDPLFYSVNPLNPSAFKLLPGSPAIDAGTSTIDAHTNAFSRVPTSDAFGSARTIGSAPDIGIYEGTGYTSTPSIDFDTLITATSGNRCIVKNSKWKIVFDMARGGGIDSMMDMTDSTTNLLPASSLLFDVKIDSYQASSQTTNTLAPAFYQRTKTRAVVRQRLAVSAALDLNVYYTIYASGHIYVQSELANLSGGSTPVGTLDYILKMNSPTSVNSSSPKKTGFGYITTASRDAMLGVTQDLDAGALSTETWTSSTASAATGTVTINTADLVDLPGYYKRQHQFLLYIGDNSLDFNKCATLTADAYAPSPVTLSSGSLLHERSWQDYMVGHWSFDDGAGSIVKDRSITNSNNATVVSGTWSTGKVGGAMHFTTSTVDTLTSTSAMEPASQSTYMFWIKPTFTGGTSMGDSAYILTKGKSTSTGWFFRKMPGASNKKIVFNVGNVSVTSPTLTDGVWTHIAGVISGSRFLSLYVNGVLSAVSTGSATVASSGVAMRMGENTGSGKQFAGDLDDVRIYSVEVTGADIQSVYNRGFSSRYGHYHLRADNNNRVVALLNESAAATRVQPAFQIDNWYGSKAPKYVFLNGGQLKPNVDYVVDSVANGIYGSYLVMQLNKTLTGSSQTLFIDDDDSTGSLGVAAAMKALTVSVASGDKITIKNFSDTVFGSATSKQWYLELDLNGWTAGATARVTDTGFGEFNSWKAAAVSPSLAISSATQLVGQSDEYGKTLVGMKFDNTNKIYSSGYGYSSPASLGYTISDSSATRFSVLMDTAFYTNGTKTMKVLKRWTVYPTGRIFGSFKIATVSAGFNLTDPQVRLTTRYNSGVDSAWAGGAGTAKTAGRWGLMDGDLGFHSIAGGLLSIKNSSATATPTNGVNAAATASGTSGSQDFKNAQLQLVTSYTTAAVIPITVNFMADISKDFTDSASADSLVKDAQTPATITALSSGTTVNNDALDFNADMFAEGDGAYTYAAVSGIAHFKFVNTVSAFNPAFRISTWSVGTLPEFVQVDNQVQVRGYNYNAYLKASSSELVIQFNKTLAPGTHVFFISHRSGLAVTVRKFEAVSGEGVDTLKWTTESEFENVGFNLYRRAKPMSGQGPSDSVIAALGKKGWGSGNVAAAALRQASAAGALAKAAEAKIKAAGGDSASDSLARPALSPEELKALGYVRITPHIIPGAPGGSSASTREYRYVDGTAAFEVAYEYLLEAVDFNGAKSHFGPRAATPSNPLETALYQNYPNPFNPITTLHFSLKEKTKVSFIIFDSKGRVVRTMISPDKPMAPGKYRLIWNAKNDNGLEVPSGQYFYRFSVPHYVSTRKMILVK
jgi:hypothetical protein